MSEVIIPWGKKKPAPKDEKERIIQEIEEKSRVHDAFAITLDMSLLEWLKEAIGDSGVIKRSYLGTGNRVSVAIGKDSEAAQMLVDRMG